MPKRKREPDSTPPIKKEESPSATPSPKPTKKPIQKDPTKTSLPDPSVLPTPSLDSTPLRMSYRIARGEQGVLTFEPYKSLLLPFWRFKTVPIAQTSSANLWSAFTSYVRRGDFVGADMARKFIQMGMTRARRYGNYKGGRKYVKGTNVGGEGGEGRVQVEKSQGHEGKAEKDAASEVFKGVWRRCLEEEGYVRLKGEFLEEQKVWDRRVKREAREAEKGGVVKEEEEDG